MLSFLGLSNFPLLELVHITALIGATFLRQRQVQMKSVELSIRTSKRSRGEATTATLAFGNMPAAEEVHVDPTTTVDPSGDDDVVDPIVTPPLRAMMESFMNTQAALGQLIDELLTEFAALRADFAEYKSAFAPPSPSNA